MRVLVSGVGQGGTCLLASVVIGLNIIKMGKGEDRKFFKYKVLPENYGTKIVSDEPTFSLENITRVMESYSDLCVIFSLRHPLDVFMAKLVRGQKPSDGGDGDLRKDVLSVVGTIEGALSAIEHFYDVYKELKTHYSERTLFVRLEDLVLMPEREVRRVAKFLNTMPTQRADEFYKYNFNKYQKRRYGDRLDTSVVNIHRRWGVWHNGFFKKRGNDISLAENRLVNVIKGLGYKS